MHMFIFSSFGLTHTHTHTHTHLTIVEEGYVQSPGVLVTQGEHYLGVVLHGEFRVRHLAGVKGGLMV